MPIAKVNQRSRSFPTRQENLGKKNMFDLSHDVKLTFTMGKLVPFLTMEVLASDEWFIRGEFMMRFAPLYLPIMHRVNMRVDYFYVPNRLMWPVNENNGSGWENFIFDPNSGLDHPYVIVTPYNHEATFPQSFELPMYMGFPTNLVHPAAVASFNINAFFFSAYYAIYDQYYRNDQIQEEIWEPLISGDNSSKMPEFGQPEYLACRYRNWNRDIFTSSTPTPQLGSDVVIPMVSDFNADGSINFKDYPTHWRKLTDGGNAPAGDIYINAADTTKTADDGGGGVYVGLDIQETAASIAQLRFALMMQEFLERGLRAGDRYSDNSVAYFGEDPYAGVIQVPVFLGSKVGKVVVSEVMSTTETATLKVGSYAGQAMSLESTNDTISYHCKEHGVILGIISVYPDSSYFQGIHKMWTRQLSLDYAWEQFALIGDEEVLGKEVNAELLATPADPLWNDGTWGYNRRYYSYTYMNDIVAGAMRTTFISFHLGRLFDPSNSPQVLLNDEFLQCRPEVTRVFQVAEGEDEIYAHIYNDVKVLRRLPKYGIPAV